MTESLPWAAVALVLALALGASAGPALAQAAPAARDDAARARALVARLVAGRLPDAETARLGRALSALGEVARRPLLAALPELGPRERVVALEVLAEHPCDAVRDALLAAARARHPEVRRAAAEGLARFPGDARAGAALVELTASEDERVAEPAFTALMTGEFPTCWDPLLEALTRELGEAEPRPSRVFPLVRCLEAVLARPADQPEARRRVRGLLDACASLDDPERREQVFLLLAASRVEVGLPWLTRVLDDALPAPSAGEDDDVEEAPPVDPLLEESFAPGGVLEALRPWSARLLATAVRALGCAAHAPAFDVVLRARAPLRARRRRPGGGPARARRRAGRRRPRPARTRAPRAPAPHRRRPAAVRPALAGLARGAGARPRPRRSRARHGLRDGRGLRARPPGRGPGRAGDPGQGRGRGGGAMSRSNASRSVAREGHVSAGLDRGRAGHSLVEIVVVVAVAAVLVLMAVGALHASTRPTLEGSTRARLLAEGDAAIARIERELASADYAGVTQVVGTWDGTTFTASPTGTGTALQFFPIAGWDGPSSTIQTDPAVIYVLRPASSDPANGVDDDRDGLVDEMQLVRISTASGLAVVLLEDVVGASAADPAERPGFTQVGFAATPPQRAGLEVRFTLARRIDHEQVMAITFAKVVSLRNLL